MSRTKSTAEVRPSYAELKQQIAALETQAEQLRKQEIAEVVARMQEAIKVYALTPDDLFPPAGAQKVKQVKSASGGKSAPKYRDPASGKTWTGNGKRPAWYIAAIEGGAAPESLAV